MEPKIELAKPRDFGEVISDTFGFIKQNLKPLLKYFFVFCGIFVLASAVINIILQLKVFAVVDSPQTNLYNPANPLGNLFNLLPEYLALLVVMVCMYVSFNVMVLCFVALYKEKQNNLPTTEEMWGYFKYFFFRVLWASFLVGLITVIGFLFCIIPGIYLGTVLALVPSIMVVENASFSYAFNQSFKLIKDNWWSTFGVLFVINIIISVLNMAVSIPAAIFGVGNTFLHLFRGTPALSVTATVTITIMESLAQFLQVLLVVATALCYFSLTETKEGTSLLGRINQFGTTDTTQDHAPEEY